MSEPDDDDGDDDDDNDDDDDTKRRALVVSYLMRRYKPMVKASGLQLLEGQDWRYSWIPYNSGIRQSSLTPSILHYNWFCGHIC
jgi:hypothetical protein